MKAVIRYKGGKGSGFHGHPGGKGGKGNPGGSQSIGSNLDIDNLPVETIKVMDTYISPVQIVGHLISPGTFRSVVKRFNSYPGWMQSGVKTIELRYEHGKDFMAGGTNFTEGASNTNGHIVLNDSEYYKSDEEVAYLLDHEVGHEVGIKWWADANREEEDAYYNHPEWFEVGVIRPEYFDNFPLAIARNRFLNSWSAGEDGISDYSKAWAKGGRWSETLAEMNRYYMQVGRNSFRDICSSEGAGTLADAYLAMVDYYESQEGK